MLEEVDKQLCIYRNNKYNKDTDNNNINNYDDFGFE